MQDTEDAETNTDKIQRENKRINKSSGGEIFRICPDRPRGPPNLLYNGYRVIPGGKAVGAWR